MQFSTLRRVIAGLTLILFISFVFAVVSSAQSKPQKVEKPAGEGKKNTRPTDEELKKQAEDKKRAEEEKNAIVDPGVERVETNAVTVDAVVYNKKTGQIVTGLKKENFAVFENGVKQNLTSFAEPESPITVSLVVEYSKWTEVLGSAAGGIWEPGQYEVIRPVAYFLSKFIKPPHDYASVIAFDLRPTPITDFTNDPKRLNDAVNLLLRNQPAFRENNLWDALKLALVGGKADSVVLENSKQETMEYGGMQDLKAPRKAIILVASGIDTFSKTNYDQIRAIIQEAGVPIYVVSTGNLFFKKYEQYLPTLDDITGGPGRMTFLQAQNAMNTIAKESGGAHFPMTFEAEVPGILNNINGLLRSQYALSYDLGENHERGKKYKLEVKVDVDGDGVYDDKAYVVQARQFLIIPKDAPAPTVKKP
jgi:Ca-activated chloride channel family protein